MNIHTEYHILATIQEFLSLSDKLLLNVKWASYYIYSWREYD